MKLALLQDAQQFRLRIRVQVADFVQKQRAVVGQFELAAAHGRGPGEGALLVSEQFALDQLAGIAAQLTFTNGPDENGLAP